MVEYPLSTKAVLRQYSQIFKSKYIPAQTTFRQQKDNLNYNSTTRIYNFFFQRMKKRRKKKISPYKNKSLSEEEEEE